REPAWVRNHAMRSAATAEQRGAAQHQQGERRGLGDRAGEADVVEVEEPARDRAGAELDTDGLVEGYARAGRRGVEDGRAGAEVLYQVVAEKCRVDGQRRQILAGVAAIDEEEPDVDARAGIGWDEEALGQADGERVEAAGLP